MSKRFSLWKLGLSTASVLGIASAFLGASPAKADTASGSYVFTSFGGAVNAYAGEVESDNYAFDGVSVNFFSFGLDGTTGVLEGDLTVFPFIAPIPPGTSNLDAALNSVFGGATPIPTLDAQLAVFDSVAESGYLD